MAGANALTESGHQQTEHQARVFGQQITETYDTSIKALRKLGVISSHQGSYGVNPSGNTVDLSEITPPSGTSFDPANKRRVSVDIHPNGDGQDTLILEWRGYDLASNLLSTEGVRLLPARHPHHKPYYLWYRETPENTGTHTPKKFESKRFDGKFGSTLDAFTQDDFLMGRYNPTKIAKSLDAKSKTVRHPNIIARLLGR